MVSEVLAECDVNEHDSLSAAREHEGQSPERAWTRRTWSGEWGGEEAGGRSGVECGVEEVLMLSEDACSLSESARSSLPSLSARRLPAGRAVDPEICGRKDVWHLGCSGVEVVQHV